MSKILLVVGKSGSGKSLITSLCEKYYNLKVLQSYTTREKRNPYEKGHTFISDEEFDKLIIKENIAAYSEYVGNNKRYCATEKQVEESDLYIIDVAGIKYFKEHYKGDKTPVVVYINSSEDMCRARMYSRGNTHEDVEKRIAQDRIEFSTVEEMADLVIDNGANDDALVLAKKLWIKYME